MNKTTTHGVRYASNPELRNCEYCETIGSVERISTPQQFVYGAGDDAMTIDVVVPVWTCASCGEGYTDYEAEEIRHEAVCQRLRRVSPVTLRAFRARWGLSQEDLAALSRFGIASIKRWETGDQIASASASQHLFLLMQPGAIDLVRNLESPEFRTEPRFQTAISEKARSRAEAFQLRPDHHKFLEAA